MHARVRGFRLALLTAFVAAFAWPLAAPRVARAAEPANSLSKVPADAETYGTMLRMGEMVEIIARSNAWKQIWSEPTVQAAWKQAVEKYQTGEGEWEPIRKFLEDPANKEIPALVGDAFSNEIFLYAGTGTSNSVALLQELTSSARYGPALQKLAGKDDDDKNRARVRIVLQSLSESPERIDIPDLVLGFKVSSPAKVTAQLKRLDPILAEALKDTPLAGRSGQAKVAGDDFLVLKLDGSLIPWEKVPIADYEDKKDEFAPLVKRLKALKLTVTIGVRQGYLLIALGESAEHLTKFGGAGPKLEGIPELKPLAKFAGKPFTSIAYTSAKLRQATAATAEDVGNMADLTKELLQTADLPADLQKAIEKDIDALARSLTGEIVKPNAAVTYTFRTPRGWETYSHDYSNAPAPKETKPLTLLNHLGGNPLLASVWRSGTTVDDYRNLVKWASVFAGHAEKVALLKSPDAEPAIKTFRKEFAPLLKELSETTEKLWLPALADGQQGFVIDAKWTSKKWHVAMPPVEEPLPLLEFAVVLGISDAAKFEQALEGYRTTINKLIAKGRELSPDSNVPEFSVPKPQVEKVKGRTFAFYPVPPIGLDEQVQPTGGLSDKVAVLTLSRGHANRLLDSNPLKLGVAPLADPKRPLESVFYFNWAGMVDTFAVWGKAASKFGDPDETAESWRLGRKVLGLVRVFHSYTSASYHEGGAAVTHSETILGDVEPEVKK